MISGNSKLWSVSDLLMRVLAAFIFGQTLFFKFAGAEESMYIFDRLGIEPWGRIGSALAELVVVLVLLIPRTAFLGALGGLAILSVAILSHLTVLGIVVQGDGGLLFGMAVLAWFCCLGISILRRRDLKLILCRIRKQDGPSNS